MDERFEKMALTALYSGKLSPCERILFFHLLRAAGQQGSRELKVSLGRLSLDAELSMGAVRRALRGLQSKGLLRKLHERSGRAAALYLVPARLYRNYDDKLVAVWEEKENRK